jgi:hypothetical protein
MEGRKAKMTNGIEQEDSRKKRKKICEVPPTSYLGPAAFSFLQKHSASKDALAPKENDDDSTEREREIHAIFLCYKSYLLICIH